MILFLTMPYHFLIIFYITKVVYVYLKHNWSNNWPLRNPILNFSHFPNQVIYFYRMFLPWNKLIDQLHAIPTVVYFVKSIIWSTISNALFLHSRINHRLSTPYLFQYYFGHKIFYSTPCVKPFLKKTHTDIY